MDCKGTSHITIKFYYQNVVIPQQCTLHLRELEHYVLWYKLTCNSFLEMLGLKEKKKTTKKIVS